MSIALFAFLLAHLAPAHAQNMALDPQNRVHVGLNYVDAPSGLGVTGGLDSRLTRVIALDVGGFASPIPIAEDYEWAGVDSETPEYYKLRHGVYATPGFRIPHAQPKQWAWDVFARVGGGVIWTANLAPNAPADTDTRYSIRPDPAGVAGADALVRFGKVGVRASGKVWMFNVIQISPIENFFTVRTQWGLEALVQW